MPEHVVGGGKDPVQKVLECLEEAPALAGWIKGVPEAVRRRFADPWEMRSVGAGQILAELPPALRIIFSGCVELTRTGQHLPGNGQSLERGSILGLHLLAQDMDSEWWLGREAMKQWVRQRSVANLLGPARVAEWLDEEEVAALFEQGTLMGRIGRRLVGTLLGSRASPPRAVTSEPTTFLELPEGSLWMQNLWELAEGLLPWLLRVYQADLLVGHIVSALGREPRFGNVSERVLFRLAESATVAESDSPPPLHQGFIPRDLEVLLSGRLQVMLPEGNIASVEAPACVGHKQFLLERQYVGDAALAAASGADTWVLVRIDGGFFRKLFQEDTGFRRALHRNNPELGPQSPGVAKHQVLVLDGEDPGALTLPRLAEALAERLAVHLQEHVRLVRLTKEKPEQEATVHRPEGSRNGWVLRQALQAEQKEGETWLLPRPRDFKGVKREGALAEEGVELGGVNVTLVDVSALDPEQRREVLKRLDRQMKRHPSEPLRLVYVTRDARRFPRPDSLPSGVELVPAAVLSETVPEGVGMALRTALDRKQELERRLEALRRAASGAKSLLGAMREHLRQVGRSPQPSNPWPMGAVRLRFREPPFTETIDRLARAATHRRVGLALGGGGPFGYVHVALIRKLLDLDAQGPEQGQEDASKRIPIDMVSGSSFGAVVGAFYCAAGPAGLELMTKHWRVIARALPLGIFSSVGIQWWIDTILGPVGLDQLEVPLFPVVADADIGVEWDMTHGSVGFGVRASGSLPPVIAPTIQGNRRLLDGGIVANVPVNVLRAEGAQVLLASNPIPLVTPRGRTFPRLRLAETLWRQLNPQLRMEDAYRMFTLLGRWAGEAQSRGADVAVYHPRINSASLFSFWKAQQIKQEASQSVELLLFLLDARARWRSLLNNPISLIEWSSRSQMLRLTDPVAFLEDGSIAPTSQRQALAELVKFLRERPEISAFRLVVTASDEQRARQQAERLGEYLREQLGPSHPFTLEVAGEAGAAEDAGSYVRLDRVKGLGSRSLEGLEDLARRKDKDVLRQALVDAEARRLELAAEQKARTGEPELARQLALEAAQLERSPRVDQLVRRVLALRGVPRGRFEADVSAYCLAWSPDGRLLAVGYKDGTLRLWNADEGWLSWEGPAHPGGSDPNVNVLAWSPDGKLLASCGNDFRIALWRLTGEALEEQGGQHLGTWNHWGLAFSPAGGLLLGPEASPGGAASAAFFRVEKGGAGLMSLGGSEVLGEVHAAAWAPGSKGGRFATVGQDKVILWQMTGKQLKQLQVFELPGARTLAWRSDGTTLAAGGASGACILHPERGVVPVDTGGMRVERVEWNQDGSLLLATLSEGGVLYVWDEAGRLRTVLRMEEEGGLEEVRCHPERPEVALTWGHALACVWDVRSSQRLAVLGGHAGAIQEAAWDSRGARLAIAAWDGRVHVWDPFSGGTERYPWSALEAPKQRDHLARIRWPAEGALAPLEVERSSALWGVFGPEWAQAVMPVRAARSGPYRPRLWTRGSPLPTKVDRQWLGEVSVHWKPGGGKVALRESDRISVWDAESGERLRECASPELDTTRVSWHPSQEWLAVGRFTGYEQLLLWDVARAKEPVSLGWNGGQDGVWDLAWSPRGEWLAAGFNDSHVRVYGVTAGEALEGQLARSLRAPHPVKRVAWSPGGELLASGHEDGSVAIWDADGEDLVFTQPLLRHRIQQLAWSPDGTALFSADEKGRAHLWRRRDDGLWEVAIALEIAPVPLLWVAFSEDGKWLAAMEQEGRVRLHPIDFEALVHSLRRGPLGPPAAARE
jgi:WD40 repeat protein/predicted acylesterase/phospholipase RssA